MREKIISMLLVASMMLSLVLTGCSTANPVADPTGTSESSAATNETEESVTESTSESTEVPSETEATELATEPTTEATEPEPTFTVEQQNSINMMNYLAALVTEINASSGSRVYLEEVYLELLNNTDPSMVDDFTLQQYIIPLAKMFPTDLSPDVFWELEKHLPVIFASQKESGSRVYSDMMQNIQILATEARAFALDNNDFCEPTADAVASYCQYAVKLIEILQDSIPGLLEKEEFFATVFYPQNTKKKPWYQFW